MHRAPYPHCLGVAMQRIRVLVVDDHRIFAESLGAALAAEQDVEVSAAGSGPAALRQLERAATEGRGFDVMLVDADLAAPLAPPLDGHPAGEAAAGVVHQTPHPPTPGHPPHPQRQPHQRRLKSRQLTAAAARGGRQAAVAPLAGAPAQASAPSVEPAPPPQRAPGEQPAGGGIPLVARVRGDHPRLRTVVLAERDDPRHAAAALQAGAGGWVAKDCSLSRLLQVIRGVLKDETHLPPALLTGVLKELTASRKHRTESEQLVESLTPREREVLRCMVAGLGRKAVAERLYLSPHTVRTHMQNVLGKLGVHSTLAAVALARRAGVGPAELEPSAAG